MILVTKLLKEVSPPCTGDEWEIYGTDLLIGYVRMVQMLNKLISDVWSFFWNCNWIEMCPLSCTWLVALHVCCVIDLLGVFWSTISLLLFFCVCLHFSQWRMARAGQPSYSTGVLPSFGLIYFLSLKCCSHGESFGWARQPLGCRMLWHREVVYCNWFCITKKALYDQPQTAHSWYRLQA